VSRCLTKSKCSLVDSSRKILSHVCHDLPEEESKVHGNEEKYHKVIQEANKSKYSLRNKVKGGEKVEQPHGSKDCHPALGRSEVKGKMNVRWLKVKEGSAELKSKVQALPTEQVVHQVSQKHRKVSEHLEKSSRLSRVTPVVSVHFSQQSVPLLNLFQVCTVSFFLGEVGENNGDSLATVWACCGLQCVTSSPNLQYAVATVDVATIGFKGKTRLSKADGAVMVA